MQTRARRIGGAIHGRGPRAIVSPFMLLGLNTLRVLPTSHAMPTSAGLFLIVAAVLSLAGCSLKLPACVESTASKASLPKKPGAAPSATTAPQAPASSKVLMIGIDGSDSMLGHAQASGAAWLHLLQSVNLAAETLPDLQARTFRVGGGSALKLSTDSATAASNPCFFKGCSPFQPVPSSLQTLWQVPHPGQSPPLRLLISDLEVNMGDISALVATIKTDVTKGASAGVLALKLPFDGQVFDSQAQPFFKGKLNRPIYLLATGPASQVADLLGEIRKIMAQKGVQSQELSFFGGPNNPPSLTARDARVIPPEAGAIGVPVQLSLGHINPSTNGDYRFIQLKPKATGFSVMTIKPWSGGTPRPDLGLVRLERIPLRSDETTSPGGIKIRRMLVAGSHLRLDLDVPRSTPSGALRATIPDLPEQWWIDWDRNTGSDATPAQKAETTEGLLLLLNTLSSEIRQARGAPPAATLCMAFQTTP